MNNSNIETLKKLGLTTYEARAYITLTSLISSTAVKISEKSTIPRSKIYDVLKNLAKKEFIEIENRRPLMYHVNPPMEILKKEKEKFNNEIYETALNLNEIYENEISQVHAPMWSIYGIEKIINKELEIIKRSKKSINMRIGFLFENEAERLIEGFKNKSNNVEINILASPKFYIDNKEINIIEIFKKNNINIYKANIPFVKMMISDSKEMIHTYTKFSGNHKSVIPSSVIGIWNQYEDIAKNYDDRFNDQLKRIKS